jgi:D-alanyl-D-alanine carboxypeptidase
MKTLRYAINAFLFISSVFATDPFQQPLLSKTRFNASTFNNAIWSFMQDRSIPGLSVALTYDDRLVYAKGFGHADEKAQLRVTTFDRFRQASVSKSVTAVAIMHLVQTGAMSLDDRVFGDDSILGYTYGTKTFIDWEREITVQHLLEHSLGFVDEDMCGEGCDPTYLEKFLKLDQWKLVTALLDEYSPSRPPGTFASYSNFGFFIAGRVIEVAAGVPSYEDYVKNVILKPMGIVNMTLALDERQKHEVKYYDLGDPEGPYKFHVNRRDSVGAWIATPIDLTKMLTAINGLPGRSDFLDQTSIDLMFTKSAIKNSSFGKGWDTVRSDEEGLVDAAKSGGYSGTRSYVNINFRNRTTYAIVVNSEMPTDNQYHGGHDLKALMDNLTFPVEDWPTYDMFPHYDEWCEAKQLSGTFYSSDGGKDGALCHSELLPLNEL